MLTDHSLLQAALEGLEFKRSRINEQIAQIKQALTGKASRPKSAKTTVAETSEDASPKSEVFKSGFSALKLGSGWQQESRPVGQGELDQLNRELPVRLQESGIAVPSNARIDDHFAIRVAHTNHRTRQEDLDLFVESVLQLGRSLTDVQAGPT